ncbi:Tye7p LALA0_S14e00738g [Lachancea lanzarotensis]|uniref:LALA0S14e00738g1_1 n=1 Tax=Lachancea lanzarotensis TaxID=1245769 RepID=A0A0C7N3T6_9SACH|nr:uncharacterized protein LALA0_S14e00738g [Lachancea lanzarotensis]CEP64852.1 LALA0S14e00738g1_1 [Lachancea lanzarotensis]
MEGSGTMTLTSGAGLPRSNAIGFEDWLFPETESGETNNSGGASGSGERLMMDIGTPWNMTEPGVAEMTGARDADSSSATSSAGSPLDQFSTLFDAATGTTTTTTTTECLGAGSAADTAVVASAGSGSNSASESPTLVKSEETAAGAGGAGLCGSQQQQQQQLPLDTLDGFADLEQAVGLGNDPETPGNALGGPGNLAARKRRAPRKRLTAHQKEAHNKIEKRYRININTKISKLQQIIPWVASEETAFDAGEGKANGSASSSSSSSSSSCNYGTDSACYASDPATAVSVRLTDVATPKLNKSMILEKAVDYILYLQNNERLYEMEVQRLKRELERSRREKE